MRLSRTGARMSETPRRARGTRLILALGLTWLPVAELSARAATFNVDRTDDVIASDCSDAVPNDCSLRGAIIAANAHQGADVINVPANVPAGSYTLVIAGRCEYAAATGDLDIT